MGKVSVLLMYKVCKVAVFDKFADKFPTLTFKVEWIRNDGLLKTCFDNMTLLFKIWIHCGYIK